MCNFTLGIIVSHEVTKANAKFCTKFYIRILHVIVLDIIADTIFIISNARQEVRKEQFLRIKKCSLPSWLRDFVRDN